VGEAAPLYYDGDRITYQTTWDRGPLSNLMRQFPDDPAAWKRELRRAGYTHVLVRPEMLLLWERAGWNDPLLTAERVQAAVREIGTPEKQFESGITIYRLD
jgi:hypothetical protein